MTEHKFRAKTLHIDKNNSSGLPRILIYTDQNEIVEITIGESQVKLIEAEIEAPCEWSCP